MKFLDQVFHLKSHNASLKNEIIGGLVTFIAMCYILPVNSAILGDMGMDTAGVFTMTAIVGCVVTLIMGLVANYPIVLSAGMGLNAYIAYTVASGMGFTWNQCMILLTISGILFFILSLTPIRKIIIEAIPTNLKYIISAALGAFICFVGLRNSGIIVGGSTLVQLGNFADPAMLIAICCVVLCFTLMFLKKKIISSLAIPISILAAAVIGVIVSSIMINNGAMNINIIDGQWHYDVMGTDTVSKLPVAPWLDNVSWGASGVQNVVFYGLLSGSYSGQQFGDDIVKVFVTPGSYVAIFSLIFVNLFDTTATLLAVGKNTGIIDKDGKMQNYQRAVLADATGALICAPLGTSTVTSFAESNIGVELGAKTGLAAVVAAILFLISAFAYPIFSIFTAGSVTAPALVCVGAMIFVGNFKDIDMKDGVVGFTAFITVIFSVLTYSIATGIGIGLICFTFMMLVSRRHKEVKAPIYIIAGLFVLSFALTSILPFFTSVS
jgi:AGZA family xanthine/uracil permease-like MFS transporter